MAALSTVGQWLRVRAADESTEWARAQDRGSDRNLTRRPGPADDAGQHGRETMHATGRGDCLGRLHARTITAGRRHSTA
jgi:hypothetical protein